MTCEHLNVKCGYVPALTCETCGAVRYKVDGSDEYETLWLPWMPRGSKVKDLTGQSDELSIVTKERDEARLKLGSVMKELDEARLSFSVQLELEVRRRTGSQQVVMDDRDEARKQLRRVSGELSDLRATIITFIGRTGITFIGRTGIAWPE